MKLSICIPIYNFDVRKLVFDLKKEIDRNALDAEIILVDDASNDKFKNFNQELKSEVEVFIFLDKNIGRARIRNLFLNYAKGDYLLFLDCDGKVINANFITNYLQLINENPETKVIFGGRVVSNKVPQDDFKLRWKFANERENLKLDDRLKIPFLSFQTNNFVIKKDVFLQNKFNSEIKKYGYEDLLFAMDLQAKKIQIDHVENPILNNDIEENKVYLSKVEDSMESLATMFSNASSKKNIKEVKVVKAYDLIKILRLSKPILYFYGFFHFKIRTNLLSKNPNLRLLDVYKLCLLLKMLKK
ncbi:glycosyltransferase family 2 protein [Chryseobacterium sp.]|uniref:glycosyltransferase family 2 protein n=1 Tax=Chryseobacterium sp. TaxID=1871047 RepID=UPI00389030F2